MKDAEVVKATGIGRSTRYEMIARREFPAPIRLSPRRIAWRSADIDEWLKSRKEAA
ncbi:AlpA family phage regulatory protein [Ralstonia solanacearum]|uniref:helix-turn-helix transcriptional regulator n=1 Tax=Ralstonia solanacearum TaxID=305 RepID=UPI0009B8EC8B